MADMLGRIILATVAVALAAVTALELRAELDYHHGQELFSEVSQKGFAADAADDIERSRDSLERASDMRPGTTALVAQAFLEKSAGRPEEAEALARQATRREPENVATWHALLSTSRDADERARAQQELVLLDPLHGER
jgi:hypothetical protein